MGCKSKDADYKSKGIYDQFVGLFTAVVKRCVPRKRSLAVGYNSGRRTAKEIFDKETCQPYLKRETNCTWCKERLPSWFFEPPSTRSCADFTGRHQEQNPGRYPLLNRRGSLRQQDQEKRQLRFVLRTARPKSVR
jgi:hypothetical protein